MIRIPSKATLKKYGLSEQDWTDILQSQGNVCAVCHKEPSTGRVVIDHYHVRGFKKMLSEEKRKYVRGILCTHCNRFYLAKGITVEKAKNIVKYLELHESRKQK